MYVHELCDWTFLRLTGFSGTTLAQPEHGWLDMSRFRDIVVWTEVKEFVNGGGTLTLAAETSPTKNEALFMALASTTVASTGVTVQAVHRTWAPVPLGHWLRWKLTTAGVSSRPEILFRMYVAATCERGLEWRR